MVTGLLPQKMFLIMTYKSIIYSIYLVTLPQNAIFQPEKSRPLNQTIINSNSILIQTSALVHKN